MAQMRKYAEDQFEKIVPTYGQTMEKLLHEIVKETLAYSGKKGMDFYEFRLLYKTKLQSILENTKRGNPVILKEFEEITKVKDIENKLVKIKGLFRQSSKEWSIDLWALDTGVDELNVEGEELREGTFDCGNCARKGRYSRNTSHYEKQTRSADEPMTIFMRCHTCSKDYRFSS